MPVAGLIVTLAVIERDNLQSANEKMNRNLTLQFLVLSVFNVLLAVALWWVTRRMACQWQELLEGISPPRLTRLVLRGGGFWPVAAAFISGGGMVLALDANARESRMRMFFFLLVLVELVCLGVHLYALALPGLNA
jgi:hypothetical protein